MDIGEIFAASGDKFEAIALDKDGLWFEKIDSQYAREIRNHHGEFQQIEEAPLVPVDPDEVHPCSWEP